MAKIIMYTTTLNYLQSKLKFKSFLLAFVSTILLTACGVKGDLYQTPEPVENTAAANVENNAMTNAGSNAESSDDGLNEPATQPVIQPEIEQETQSSNNSETEQQ